MKKSWEKPQVSHLKLSETEYGTTPNHDHDATTYDNDGNWWASGTKDS